jgi:arginase
MPLRMIIDSGAVEPVHVALVGARSLDPPEVEFIAASGIRSSAADVLADIDCAYVAFDLDVLEPSSARPFMPEPGGPTVAEAEQMIRAVASRARVVGAGFTGGTPDPENVAVIERLAAALGL